MLRLLALSKGKEARQAKAQGRSHFQRLNALAFDSGIVVPIPCHTVDAQDLGKLARTGVDTAAVFLVD
jgi:hypothetical protein